MSSRTLAGRYELLEKIGDGGMAVVYKARDKLLNRFIAVKILKPDFTKDVKFIESFRRESQAAASLSHPNIVNIFDVGREGNINYIVMELIEGQTLSEVIRKQGALKPREAVAIAKQIASALNLAHANHIIHRDVKPHNILITRDGTAKITDFGIAKAINTGTIVGNTGTVMGSVHYFSPEQARGGYVDEKTDIYSLGIVLYEMLTGRVPFDADNPVAVAMKHMNEEMIPPSKVIDGIPPDLEAIVLKASNKYQINRYKSAADMLEALSNVSFIAGGYTGYTRKNDIDATVTMAAVNNNVKNNNRGLNEENNEDKGLKGKKKKFRINKVKIAAIILALICAIPVSQLILSAIEAGKAPVEVPVPDVTGITVEDATAKLNEVGLNLEVDKEVVSDEFEEGLIVSQDPLADMVVKTGKTVKVNVSKGIKEGTVPNVIGKTLGDAVFLLESHGYEKGGVSEEYNQMPKGVVIRQSPQAGTAADAGSGVNMVISLGEEIKKTTVPSLLGLDLDAAKDVLARENLALGEVNHGPSNTYDIDLICGQSIQPETTVDSGTPIDLTISTGPDESAGSAVVQIPISYAEAKNEVFYLTVMVSDNSGVTVPINYEQRIKSNGSEIFEVTGTGQGSVKIYFDNALVQEYSVDFDSGAIL